MSTTVLEFEIPGEPKGKARPVVTRSGHAFTPKGTVLFESLVASCFNAKYPQWVPASGEINMIIAAYFPIPKTASIKKKTMMLSGAIHPTRKPDLDNIAKAVCDSLNNIMYTDDSHVTALTIWKSYSEKPHIYVRAEIKEE